MPVRVLAVALGIILVVGCGATSAREQVWPQGIAKGDTKVLSQHGWAVTQIPDAASDGQADAVRAAVANFGFTEASQIATVTRAKVQDTFNTAPVLDAWVVYLPNVESVSSDGEASAGPMMVLVRAHDDGFIGALQY